MVCSSKWFSDAFPFIPSQWNDTDSDGFGDNWADGSWNDTRMNWSIESGILTPQSPMLVHLLQVILLRTDLAVPTLIAMVGLIQIQIGPRKKG